MYINVKLLMIPVNTLSVDFGQGYCVKPQPGASLTSTGHLVECNAIGTTWSAQYSSGGWWGMRKLGGHRGVKRETVIRQGEVKAFPEEPIGILLCPHCGN